MDELWIDRLWMDRVWIDGGMDRQVMVGGSMDGRGIDCRVMDGLTTSMPMLSGQPSRLRHDPSLDLPYGPQIQRSFLFYQCHELASAQEFHGKDQVIL